MKAVFAIGLLCIMFFGSCEKDVTITLDNTTPKLCVDASIEENMPPIVFLTYSTPYFSTFNLSQLQNLFVRNAVITISNGVLTHQLKEYSYQINSGTIYFYSLDSNNLSTAFLGQRGKTYQLNISVDGKTYTATSFMPSSVMVMDSILTETVPLTTDTTIRNLKLIATDPAGLGNYGRYFTKINSQPFYAGENSSFTDQIVDGTTFSLLLPKGYDRNNPPKRDSNYYKKGDTITVKFCNIDRNAYNFWNTWEFAQQSIGNPFSQPNKVESNISNNALGAFTAYSVQLKTIIAK